MDFGWLKKYMPRSLFGRAVLIMLFPLIVLQLVVGQVFIQRHFQQVTAQMTHALALELNYALQQIELAETVEGAQAALDEISINMEMLLLLGDALPPKIPVLRQFTDLSGVAVVETLQNEITQPLTIDLKTDYSKVSITIVTAKGTLEALIARTRVAASNPHQLLVLMILTSIILVTISIGFLRIQIRPIRRLARAAEAFGKGQQVPLHPSGSTEVRRAALAFISMRNKLEHQIDERTKMLSAVSHDLRTPLTRMKLAVEMLDDPEGIPQDIAEMEKMLDEFLAFAREDYLEETQPTNPETLLRDVVQKAGCDARNILIEYEVSNRLPVLMRPESVSRALQNLIGNAVQYGDKTRFSMILSKRFLEYRFEDNGPGIPENQRAKALMPFARLEPARGQNKGGNVGLGLAIAADIAKNHGGMLVMSESEELGGLCASFRIPR